MHTRPPQHLNHGPTAKLTWAPPAGGAHLVPWGRTASGAGALCPPSGSRRGRASRRPRSCRPRRCQALQGGAAKRRRARFAIFPRRCSAHRRPALQPCAGTYICHRSRQSQWSSARAARRSALRCATPPRPFRKLPIAENFGFTESTNRGHPLHPREGLFLWEESSCLLHESRTNIL